MPFGRRLLILLVILTAAGIPAVALRAACAGRSCSQSSEGSARVPFCPLPARLKTYIEAGYRAGRSPDVVAVTKRPDVWGGTGAYEASLTPPWPSVSGSDTAVPIVFSGAGVSSGTAIGQSAIGLDQVAPTISEILGLRRPHPEVRAGRPVSGLATEARTRLVLEVAWKGVGSSDLRSAPHSWPFLRSLIKHGAGTLEGDTGSLPLDPTATLTTIGTGGLPSQHGITGTLVLNAQRQLTRAWGRSSPRSVIATLPDDFDQAMNQQPLIGLVATDPADRGIIGGNWYIGHDTDQMAFTREDQTGAVIRMLASGFGRDEVPDILAVVMQDSISQMDQELSTIVSAADREAGGAVSVVVAGTGSNTVPTASGLVRAADVAHDVEASIQGNQAVVSAAVPGGLFLNQRTLAAEGISGDAAVQAVLKATGPNGAPLMQDAFQGFAISFARYC